MTLDGSIQDLVLLLNQIGIQTNVSCSGLLVDHEDNYCGTCTPYLCITRSQCDYGRYKTFREIMIDSGFNVREGSRESSECYYFDFGHGMTDPKIAHDLEYGMLDEPEWQGKIKIGWSEVYHKVLDLAQQLS